MWFLEPALTVATVSWWFLLIIRVIDDECKFFTILVQSGIRLLHMQSCLLMSLINWTTNKACLEMSIQVFLFDLVTYFKTLS